MVFDPESVKRVRIEFPGGHCALAVLAEEYDVLLEIYGATLVSWRRQLDKLGFEGIELGCE